MTTKEVVALLERYSNYDGMGIPNLAGCKEAMRVAVDALKEACPELAESEDERIRKAILGLTYIDGIEPILTKCSITAGDIRTYLEKQKEKEKYNRMMPVYDNLDSFESALAKAWKTYNDSGSRTVDGCEDDYVECAHAKGFREGYLFGLEKQKDLDKMIVVSSEVWDNAIADAYENGKKEGEKQKEQKEIPLMGGDTDTYFDDLRITTKPLTSREWFDEGIKYAQRLQKEQKPAEWSEEDEEMLNSCISSIEESKENRYAYKETDGDTSYDREVDWLKSLRPQPHWKPSEEQMEALNALNLHGDLSYVGQQNQLISLYQDLKKLI